MAEDLALAIVQAAKMMDETTLDHNKEYTTITFVTGEYFFSHQCLQKQRSITDAMNELIKNGFVYNETKVLDIFDELNIPNIKQRVMVFARLRNKE